MLRPFLASRPRETIPRFVRAIATDADGLHCLDGRSIGKLLPELGDAEPESEHLRYARSVTECLQQDGVGECQQRRVSRGRANSGKILQCLN